jgi:CheY-like chemotaxis protein
VVKISTVNNALNKNGVVASQPPAASRQPPAASRQPPAASRQPPADSMPIEVRDESELKRIPAKRDSGPGHAGPRYANQAGRGANVSRVTISMKRITVLLADDNGVVRKEFKRILELEDDLEVVGVAKNGHQAVAMVKKLRPALVLMDVRMPLLNGFQSTRQILETVPATKVLILSAYGDDAYVAEAVNSGAVGYLIKQTSAGNVCLAIREVHRGNTFFSPSIPKRLHKRNREK